MRCKLCLSIAFMSFPGGYLHHDLLDTHLITVYTKKPDVEDKVTKQLDVEDKVTKQPDVEDKVKQQPGVKSTVTTGPRCFGAEKSEYQSHETHLIDLTQKINPIPEGLCEGTTIYISGKLFGTLSYISILGEDKSQADSFHFAIMNRKTVSMQSRLKGQAAKTIVQATPFPFVKDKMFEMNIEITSEGFKITIDNVIYNYQHESESIQSMKYIRFSGVELSSVKFD